MCLLVYVFYYLGSIMEETKQEILEVKRFLTLWTIKFLYHLKSTT